MLGKTSTQFTRIVVADEVIDSLLRELSVVAVVGSVVFVVSNPIVDFGLNPFSESNPRRYLWADNTTIEPLKLSAPAYVNRLFSWIEEQLNDENIFPTSLEQDFPSNFRVRIDRCHSADDTSCPG